MLVILRKDSEADLCFRTAQQAPQSTLNSEHRSCPEDQQWMSSPLSTLTSREESLPRKSGKPRPRVAYPAENWTTACLSLESAPASRGEEENGKTIPQASWSGSAKESNVRFTGKSQGTKGPQQSRLLMWQSSHSSHRSLGTYSAGDCTWITEVQIREKADRSLGGEGIKKTHLPRYRKNIFTGTKNYCKKQVLSP